jgi:hypothetical protein
MSAAANLSARSVDDQESMNQQYLATSKERSSVESQFNKNRPDNALTAF